MSSDGLLGSLHFRSSLLWLTHKLLHIEFDELSGTKAFLFLSLAFVFFLSLDLKEASCEKIASVPLLEIGISLRSPAS